MALCTWCHRGLTKKHHDPAKAAQGITLCNTCGMAHSPHATIKGSYAYWDGEKIVTGVLSNARLLQVR